MSTHAHICTSQVCRGTFVSKTISKMLTAMMTPMTVLSKSLDIQCLAKHCEFLWYPAEDVWGFCGIRYTGYTSPFLAKKKANRCWSTLFFRISKARRTPTNPLIRITLYWLKNIRNLHGFHYRHHLEPKELEGLREHPLGNENPDTSRWLPQDMS